MPEETTTLDAVAETARSTETQTESTPDWKSSLPDDIKNHASIADINSVEDLAKRTINSQKMVGSNVYLPDEKDGSDKWNEFYKKIGKPNDASDYHLKSKFKSDGETAIVSDDLLSRISQASYDADLTTRQANKLLGFCEELNTKSENDSDDFLAKVKQDGIDQLQKIYGDSYDQKIEMAREVMRQSPDGAELIQAVEASGLGMSPVFIKHLIEVGEMKGEDRMLGRNKVDLKLDPESARTKINELRADPDTMKIRQDKGHPRHEEVTNVFNKLYKELSAG